MSLKKFIIVAIQKHNIALSSRNEINNELKKMPRREKA